MKKRLSKVSVCSLILTFFSSAVLCCHPLGAGVAEAGNSHCALRKVEKVKSKCGHCLPRKDEGFCCVKQLPAEQPDKISLNAPHSGKGFLLVSLLNPQQVVPRIEFKLARHDNGPPGPVCDQPLYIPYHNFRI